jgi:hypothetical protein
MRLINIQTLKVEEFLDDNIPEHYRILGATTKQSSLSAMSKIGGVSVYKPRLESVKLGDLANRQIKAVWKYI